MEQGLYDPVKNWLLLTGSPLGKHFINFSKISPKLPETTEVISPYVAYIKVDVHLPMVHLTRLKAVGVNPDADAPEIDVPTSAIVETMLPDGKTPFGTCRLVSDVNNNIEQPYVILNRYVAPPYTSIIPKESIADHMEVLFITKPITEAEVTAATQSVSLRTHLSKNERAQGQIGQLQFVKEPAGKLRTFAMVDV